MSESAFGPNDEHCDAIHPAQPEPLFERFGIRVYRAMWVLGALGLPLFWYWKGWRWGAGFAIGATLSALNFHWLHSAVDTIGHSLLAATNDNVPPERNSPSAMGSAFRILLRYALMGGAAYAIFISSLVSLTAFFIGLFLFLGAVLVEAAYELWIGLRSAAS
jgi:hypothetical protein